MKRPRAEWRLEALQVLVLRRNAMQITRNSLRAFAITATIAGLAACQTTGGYQETRSSSFNVSTGERIEVGSFYEIKTASCSVQPRPIIVITKKPKLGQLTFEEIIRKPKQANCSTIDVPALKAIYTASETAGVDTFAYEVKYQSTNLGTWLVAGDVKIDAASSPNPYKAAVAALMIAGGSQTCVSCFLERYAPAEFNKAFAVSKDGAFGGRWSANISVAEAREAALESCRSKPEFKPENECAVFFENDRQVWVP